MDVDSLLRPLEEFFSTSALASFPITGCYADTIKVEWYAAEFVCNRQQPRKEQKERKHTH